MHDLDQLSPVWRKRFDFYRAPTACLDRRRSRKPPSKHCRSSRGCRGYFGPWGFDLGTIQQSVTIWHGEEDIVMPTKCARRLHNQLPNSTLKVVLETGHVLPLVAADQILKDLAP